MYVYIYISLFSCAVLVLAVYVCMIIILHTVLGTNIYSRNLLRGLILIYLVYLVFLLDYLILIQCLIVVFERCWLTKKKHIFIYSWSCILETGCKLHLAPAITAAFKILPHFLFIFFIIFFFRCSTAQKLSSADKILLSVTSADESGSLGKQHVWVWRGWPFISSVVKTKASNQRMASGCKYPLNFTLIHVLVFVYSVIFVFATLLCPYIKKRELYVATVCLHIDFLCILKKI